MSEDRKYVTSYTDGVESSLIYDAEQDEWYVLVESLFENEELSAPSVWTALKRVSRWEILGIHKGWWVEFHGFFDEEHARKWMPVICSVVRLHGDGADDE